MGNGRTSEQHSSIPEAQQYRTYLVSPQETEEKKIVTLASFAVPDLSLVMSCPDADTCLAVLVAVALFSIDVVLIYTGSFLEVDVALAVLCFWCVRGLVCGRVGVHKERTASKNSCPWVLFRVSVYRLNTKYAGFNMPRDPRTEREFLEIVSRLYHCGGPYSK